jgi:hypothetical protein
MPESSTSRVSGIRGSLRRDRAGQARTHRAGRPRDPVDHRPRPESLDYPRRRNRQRLGTGCGLGAGPDCARRTTRTAVVEGNPAGHAVGLSCRAEPHHPTGRKVCGRWNFCRRCGAGLGAIHGERNRSDVIADEIVGVLCFPLSTNPGQGLLPNAAYAQGRMTRPGDPLIEPGSAVQTGGASSAHHADLCGRFSLTEATNC